jgi:hypothetical protein
MMGGQRANARRDVIHEFEMVVLTREIPEHNLVVGDVGTVVHCYEDGLAYEAEFMTVEGKTVALLTLTNNDIRLTHESWSPDE